ncbi:MAG: response regulator transcription factor [Anaerolineales bacterium]|nr:response regulator transcription factor [Anaerolineales bacterium]
MTERISAGKILVVEDEPKLVQLLRRVLTATHFQVVTASKGEIAVEMAALEQPDLILLDLVLAGEMDGYGVARHIREFSDVPIVMLTAKAREADLLRGYEAGTDDYLTKPFSSRELLARVRAVLKRTRREAGAAPEAEIVCGALRLDLARRRVMLGNAEVRLTRTEYNLLRELAAHANQVMMHGQLLTAVWGPEYRNDLDYLRAYVRFLRKKLEADPADPKLIVTAPGVGYMLACPDQAA